MKVPDSHAHLADRKFEKDRQEVVERAIKAGVSPVMVPCSMEEFGIGLDLAEKYPFLHLSLGVHPHEARTWDRRAEEALVKAIHGGFVKAIGEIGLDYHYDFSPRERQRDAFKRQMEMAEKHSLPVIIHSRESAEDVARIISQYDVKGVLHSFSEEFFLAEEALSLGYYLSFSGMLTFKWGERIREVARRAPLDRVLVETDSPYLAPVPFRGRRNEPAFVLKVAEKLAEVKGVTLQALAPVLLENYEKLFGGEDGKPEKEDKGNQR